MTAREAFIARHFNFDGERQHYVTKGNGLREKRGFRTEAGARAYLAAKKLDMDVYRCSVCGQWHTARRRRAREATG